jgi:homoaconitase/3-isopropylmalate dehydratase large subunit
MVKNGVTNINEHIGIPISEQNPKPDTNPNIVAITPIPDKYIGDCDNGPRTDRQKVATIIITRNVTTTNFISID